MTSIQEIMTLYNKIASALPSIHIRDIIEMALIAIAFYQIIKWSRKTRAWMLFKGIVVLVIFILAATLFQLNAILWIFRNVINVSIIALVIVFQPELRRVLETLGRRTLINNIFDDHLEHYEGAESIINEIVEATYDMAKVKTGALIVIQQNEDLSEFESTGIKIGALVTRQLLVNIFEHNTPLHDGAVIIRDNTIVAATCYLPLSDNMSLSKDLGTRHRAGIGMAEVSDAIVIIVSEETGRVSLAMDGNLVRNIDPDYLKNKLLHTFTSANDKPNYGLKYLRGRIKRVKKNTK